MKKHNIFTFGSVLIIMVGLVFWAVKGGSIRILADPDADYKKIMAYDFDTEYPKTPNEVMEIYNEIDKFLYGKSQTDQEQLVNVMTQRCMLLDSDILAMNTIEGMVATYNEIVGQLEEMDAKMIGYSDELAEYGNDLRTARVRVTQFWNANEKVEFDYYLQKNNNGLWKINAWIELENFDENLEESA